jgi:hypothetical protein
MSNFCHPAQWAMKAYQVPATLITSCTHHVILDFELSSWLRSCCALSRRRSSCGYLFATWRLPVHRTTPLIFLHSCVDGHQRRRSVDTGKATSHMQTHNALEMCCELGLPMAGHRTVFVYSHLQPSIYSGLAYHISHLQSDP